MRRVVITGWGLVSPLGNSLGSALASAAEGRSGIRSCERFLWGEFGAEIACRVAGTIEGLDPTPYVPSGHADAYDPAIVYALAAADEALGDAALAPFLDANPAARDRVGVVIGSAGPGCVSYHRALHQAFVERTAHRLPGSLSLQMSGNMPPSLVALRHQLRGPNFGIVNACASGATALATATEMIRAGSADAVIGGGTESCIGLTLLGSMGNVGAINPTSDPHRASRPFCADRAGLIMAEGAGLMVLEEREQALARGARIHGEVLGISRTNDAHHVYNPDPTGALWGRAIELALRDARIAPDEVGAISAHAASTQRGDLAETLAIKRVLGAHAYRVPVSATKSMHGHAYGAAGAIESILSLAAMGQGWVPPTAHLSEPDPDCDLDYVPNVSRKTDAEILLKNSFGFGGTNSCLVFRCARG